MCLGTIFLSGYLFCYRNPYLRFKYNPFPTPQTGSWTARIGVFLVPCQVIPSLLNATPS
jgi:hypothetical protein